MTKNTYTAKDITVLEGLEPVRLRPGMYIGSTGARGLHHLVYEVVDNSVDEALAGRNDHVEVTLHPDNSVTVSDRGAGIPVELIEDQGLSALTVGNRDRVVRMEGDLDVVVAAREGLVDGVVDDLVDEVVEAAGTR